MVSRESSPFGGNPVYFPWFRGDVWKFASAKTDAKPSMSDRLEYVAPEWAVDRSLPGISLPGTTEYEPLVDTPRLYLDFMALGEKAWAEPSPSIPELAELALEFTRGYGPLENKRRPTLKEIIKEAKTLAWAGKSYLATGGESEAEECFWPRTIEIFGEGIDDGPEMKPGSAERNRFISVLIERIAQLQLERFKVSLQIRVILGDPTQQPGYERTYKPASLTGAIWAQFTSTLIRKSVLRRCKREECLRIFEAPNPASRLEYCPRPPAKPDGRQLDGCQIKVNRRRKYLRSVAAKSKQTASKAGE